MKLTTVRLGDISETTSGGTPQRGVARFYGGAIPWVKSGELPDGLVTKTEESITEAGLAGSSTKLLPKGTLLIAMYGATVGKLGILDMPAATNQAVCAILPSSTLDRDYLFYWLFNIREKLVTASFGGAQPNISQSVVRDLKVPLPNIKRQQEVAAQLKTQLAAVEEARQAAQTQLQEAKRLIPAILRAAFDNLTDAEWTPIGDVAKTTSGTTPSRGQKNLWEPPLHPWVKTGEVAFKTINQTEESVSAKALAECSLTLLPVGTVLVAMYGQGKTRGQSALLNVVATTNQACFAILPSEELDPEYLQFWLRHSYEALRSLSDSRGGNQSNLNGALMNAFELPLLPIEQQKSIASHIKQAIADANALQQTVEMQLQDIELLPSRLLAQVFDATD